MGVRKKKLFDHFVEASKEHDGPCVIQKKTKELKPCPALAAVLSVHIEDGRRQGFELAPMFQISTGKSIGTKLVYFARRAEYVEVEHCPFCGNKVSSARKK